MSVLRVHGINTMALPGSHNLPLVRNSSQDTPVLLCPAVVSSFEEPTRLEAEAHHLFDRAIAAIIHNFRVNFPIEPQGVGGGANLLPPGPGNQPKWRGVVSPQPY